MQLEDAEVFATGLHFPEGPVAMSDGSVIAVEIYGGRDRVHGIIEEARTSGLASLLTGGERLGAAFENGYFLQPTVFGDVDPSARIAREEIFAPVLSALRFTSEEEAVALANNTRYALSAFVHTSDVRRAHRVANQLKAGSISVNGINPLAPGCALRRQRRQRLRPRGRRRRDPGVHPVEERLPGLVIRT
jgi:Aldehyde dehydrogenase family